MQLDILLCKLKHTVIILIIFKILSTSRAHSTTTTSQILQTYKLKGETFLNCLKILSLFNTETSVTYSVMWNRLFLESFEGEQ